MSTRKKYLTVFAFLVATVALLGAAVINIEMHGYVLVALLIMIVYLSAISLTFLFYAVTNRSIPEKEYYWAGPLLFFLIPK